MFLEPDLLISNFPTIVSEFSQNIYSTYSSSKNNLPLDYLITTLNLILSTIIGSFVYFVFTECYNIATLFHYIMFK